MIRKIITISPNSQIGTNISFSISTDALNVRLPLRDPSTKKLTDQYIHNYENPMFRAYLQKRKLTRPQVWPRIRILPDPPSQQQVHIKNQKTLDIKRLLSESVMKRIVKQDPSQINTAFIVSLFSEDNFKQLVDQYLGKVLVCGKCPSEKNAEKMKQIQINVVELFKSFYFGQKISPLQREIQMNYLASKQMKFSFMQTQKKNGLYRCIWRDQDQRLIEDYANWPQSNINLTDLGYRPFYERLSITSRLPHAKKLYQLIEGSSWLANWNFKTVQKNYMYSIPYLTWISSKMFSRVIQYTKCLQFTHTMKIPADFSIEILVTNIHFWLIINRLRQFNTQKSKNLANMLDEMFRHYVNDLIGQLHMRRQAAVVRRFNQFINIASNTLNRHFNVNQKTRNNPYISIDALVWSVAMKQKTQRYSQQVYLFSEYLVKNWINFKNYTEEDFMDGLCQFDSFLIDPDYKQKIIEINPPIPKQKFSAQFQTNEEKKSFYYSTQIPKEDESERILNVFSNNAKKQSYHFWRELGNKTIHFIKKYMTNLSNYDQMSQMDEQKKKTSIKDLKSPWKTETDRVGQVQKEFDEISKIKKIRRKTNSSEKEQQKKNQQK